MKKNQQNECAPSEDSDQPGHPPSLIRVFAVRMKKAWGLSYPLSAQRRLIWLGGLSIHPVWSESSLGAHSFCWFCHVVAHLPKLLYLNAELTHLALCQAVSLLPQCHLRTLSWTALPCWDHTMGKSCQLQNYPSWLIQLLSGGSPGFVRKLGIHS